MRVGTPYVRIMEPNETRKSKPKEKVRPEGPVAYLRWYSWRVRVRCEDARRLIVAIPEITRNIFRYLRCRVRGHEWGPWGIIRGSWPDMKEKRYCERCPAYEVRKRPEAQMD